MKHLIAAALFVPLAFTHPLQDSESSGSQPSRPQRVQGIPSISDFGVELYTPKYQDLDQLYGVANEIYGRQASLQHDESGNITSHNTVQRMGNSIVVYESKLARARILAALADLDAKSEGSKQERVAVSYKTAEYRAKHVPLNSLIQALQSFQRIVHIGGNAFPNLTPVNDRGLVIIRDESKQVERMLEVLDSVDRPSQQVLVSAYLVSASDQTQSSGLPQELISGLVPLLGAKGIVPHAKNLIRTSVGQGSETNLSFIADHGDSYSLDFSLSAFDPESRVITLGSCSLTENENLVFRTQTSIGADEYVVLGATGADPAYVVLHMRLL